MTRKPTLFKAADITRLTLALERAGKTVYAVEITAAGDIIAHCQPVRRTEEAEFINPWDEVLPGGRRSSV